MALCDINGKPIASAGNGVTITECNLFNKIGGIYVEGYQFSTSHKLEADESYNTVYAKLCAGEHYLFTFDTSCIMHIVAELPDVETLKTTAISNYVAYNWAYRFFEKLKSNTGSYVYTPDTDVYILVGIPKGENLYIWHPEDITGDIHPGSTIGTSFATWNQDDDGYTRYPFNTILNDTEKIEVSEELKKGAIRATDINRIQGGNVPLIYVGDSIVVANSVGIENCYRKNSAKTLDLPWTYNAANGATITDGYGMTWDQSENTAMTGYSGFIATEGAGFAKAENAEYKYKQAKILIFALGTNDFGNDAPLGTIDDTGTDTFYGAFKAFLNYFRGYNPDLPIILVTPFKRDTWAAKNEQNLYLIDYIHAMYRVAREYTRIYILDVFTKWYSDTDNEAIRSRNSVDGIHPSTLFHDCFTMDLVQKIKEVCALEGIIA